MALAVDPMTVWIKEEKRAPLGALQSPADRGLHFLPGEQTARPDPYVASHEDGLGHPGDPKQSREGGSGAAISGLSAKILGLS
jgi:hypothetical protein